MPILAAEVVGVPRALIFVSGVPPAPFFFETVSITRFTGTLTDVQSVYYCLLMLCALLVGIITPRSMQVSFKSKEIWIHTPFKAHSAHINLFMLAH